jgi:hypothetical protein
MAATGVFGVKTHRIIVVRIGISCRRYEILKLENRRVFSIKKLTLLALAVEKIPIALPIKSRKSGLWTG